MPKEWLPLQKGDCIQLIAPASKVLGLETYLQQVKFFLEKWGLQVKITNIILGEDENFPNLANTDEKRFEDFQAAVLDPTVKAIWCIRGGYGSIRLLQQIRKLTPPDNAKLFIGFSDTTLLLIYLCQKWNWNTIHGPTALQAAYEKVASADIEHLRQLIFGEINKITITDLNAMNDAANKNTTIESEIIGGNLTLISRTLGLENAERINIKDKIFVMEDHSEPFRKVDGILQQMALQDYFSESNKPAAVIIGDFSITVPLEQSQVDNALQQFAQRLNHINVPVFRCLGIGHQTSNHPLPIGPKAILTTGNVPYLTIKSGANFS